MTRVVSSRGHQQDGDVDDGAMVADGAKAAHGGLLHDQGVGVIGDVVELLE